jgi:hypothetical protein
MIVTQQDLLAARFYGLVRTQVKRKRMCLRCEKVFMSSSAGQRQCDECMRANLRKGTLAQTVIVQQY